MKKHEILKQAQDDTIKIILTGGGTLGSVTPLLAIADELLVNETFKFSLKWLGTSQGVERQLIANYPIDYQSIAAGKLRRYFSFKNFIDIFALIIGFLQTIFIFIKQRPKLVISAGSFVSVSVIWAAKLLGIKTLIHQQDIRSGLANRLMAPCASVITVAFEKSLADYGKKAIWTGNPIRKEFKKYSVETGYSPSLQNILPTVLILGGGTGSEVINKLVLDNIETLVGFCKIIHIRGKHYVKTLLNINELANYQAYDLLATANMAEAFSKADLVVARAGLGTLSELAYLGKPSIIIPIPNSHQEDNAKYFAEREAIYLLDQKKISNEMFVKVIKDLLMDKQKRSDLAQAMANSMKQSANQTILEIIKTLL